MTNPIEDGGPAFPESCTKDGHRPNVMPGMSLRDWFAGQALYLAEPRATHSRSQALDVAKYAYLIADAMLIERSKQRSA